VERSLDRRSLLLGSVALALAACRKSGPPAPAASAHAKGPPPPGGTWSTQSFEPGTGAPEGQRASFLNPWGQHGAPKPTRRPLLVALHGRGEARRDLDVGAQAWRKRYELEKLIPRLYAPPLTGRDLHDMTSPERLEKLNESLDAVPYRGLALACPYTPDLPDTSPAGARDFARFVIEQLLPSLRRETGSKTDRRGTGIDGVSMGGRLALFIGLANPDVFSVVGAIQPAIKPEEAPMISMLAQRAMALAPVKLRLVSSDDDNYLPAVMATSVQLHADGVDHELLVVPGSHGYTFNCGPGGAELLLWHERMQRGLLSPGASKLVVGPPPAGPTDDSTDL
jgi:iron(III)-salmochelin esterase